MCDDNHDAILTFTLHSLVPVEYIISIFMDKITEILWKDKNPMDSISATGISIDQLGISSE